MLHRACPTICLWDLSQYKAVGPLPMYDCGICPNARLEDLSQCMTVGFVPMQGCGTSPNVWLWDLYHSKTVRLGMWANEIESLFLIEPHCVKSPYLNCYILFIKSQWNAYLNSCCLNLSYILVSTISSWMLSKSWYFLPTLNTHTLSSVPHS